MPQFSALLVGNSRFLRGAASSMLANHGLRVFSAKDGEHALQLAALNRPDIVLLDSMQAEAHWAEILQQFRQNAETSGIPIIILGGLTHEKQNYSGSGPVDYGPVDFVNKDSAVLDQLSLRIRNYLRQKPS